MSNKAFKYRLYPNKEQSKHIDNTISYARKMHNLMIEGTIAHYEQTQEFKVPAPIVYKSQYSYFYEADTTAYNREKRFVETAFKNFFVHRKDGVGFPKFKSKHTDTWSYTSSFTNNNIRLTSVVDGKEVKLTDENFVKYTYIKLPRIGFVRCIVDRPIPSDYRIISATVTKTRTNKYFVSVLVEYDAEIPVLDLDLEKSLGLDYSQDDFYVDSQGMKGEYPQFFKRSKSKLANAERKLSRTQKHSKNHEKARLRVAKVHEKIANQRKDWQFKKVKEIADNPDVHYVFIEDISIKDISNKRKTVTYRNGKTRKSYYGKTAFDNGWYTFISRLSNKLILNGKCILKIGKYFPSTKMCSNCGYVDNLYIDDRVYVCPECHTVIDRDYNAALNIKREGIRLVNISNRRDDGVSPLNYSVRLNSI